MRRRFLIAVFYIIALTACQASPTPPTATPMPPTSQVVQPLELEFGEPIDFTRGGVSIVLPRPKGWEELAIEPGVMIAERFARLADRGVQQGLMASVFVTPLSEFPEAAGENEPLTHEILKSLIEAHPDGERRSSEVQPFNWSGYDAAYYLVSEAESGPRILIVGLTLPDEGMLLTGSVSAPRARAGQIRAVAPLLLGGVAVNGVALGPDGLDALPEPLVFPE